MPWFIGIDRGAAANPCRDRAPNGLIPDLFLDLALLYAEHAERTTLYAFDLREGDDSALRWKLVALWSWRVAIKRYQSRNPYRFRRATGLGC